MQRARTAVAAVTGLTLLVIGLAGPAATAQAASPVPAVPASSAPASSKVPVVTFGVEPYSPPSKLGVSSARPYFGYSLTPGAHVHDVAALLNYSTQPLLLSIGVADAVNTSTGGFALRPPTQRSLDVGTWVILPVRKTYLVPARHAETATSPASPGEVLVPMTMIVPQNAQPGDHAGGMVATLESSIRSASGQLFHLDQRVGSRIFVRVVGPLHPRLTISNLVASYHATANPAGKGSATVSYTVQNTGNVALGGNQTVSISGLFGPTASAVRMAQVPLLLPGGSVRFRVTVPGVWPTFRLTAHVTIKLLVLPGSTEPAAGPFTATEGLWAIPWVLLGIVVLVGLAGWWYVRRRRRGGRQGPPQEKGYGARREPTQPLGAGHEQAAELVGGASLARAPRKAVAKKGSAGRSAAATPGPGEVPVQKIVRVEPSTGDVHP